MFIKAGARNLLLQGERQKFLAEQWPRIHATIQRLGLTPKELLEAAKTSPYAKIYSGAREGANKGRGSSKTTPEDCARVILEAIESSHPKARYPVTPLAKWLSIGKRFLPDTLLDSFLRRKFGVIREA